MQDGAQEAPVVHLHRVQGSGQGKQARQQRDQRQDLQHRAQESPAVHLRRPHILQVRTTPRSAHSVL